MLRILKLPLPDISFPEIPRDLELRGIWGGRMTTSALARLGKTFQIAFRNICRNRRRSMLTLMTLVLGSTGLILIGGFFDNLILSLREQYIHSLTGHLQVSAQGYYDKGASSPFKYLLKNSSQVEDVAAKNPHVRYTVPVLKMSGMVSSEETSVAVIVFASDPDKLNKMGSYQHVNEKQSSIHIREGKALSSDDRYGAVLGQGLMKSLGLKVGDSFNLISTREAGAIDGMTLTVRGVFQTIFKDYDDRAIQINLTAAQSLWAIPDQIHNLLVVLDETENTEGVKAALLSQFQGAGQQLEVVTWEEQGHYVRQAKALLQKIFHTLLVIIAFIVFFSIANTINMVLFERMREFGTMMAIGANHRSVFWMIFAEAILLGLIGSTLGLLVGWGFSELVTALKLELPPPPQGNNIAYVVIALSPSLFLLTFATVMVSNLLSAILPAYRASHIKIVNALGYV